MRWRGRGGNQGGSDAFANYVAIGSVRYPRATMAIGAESSPDWPERVTNGWIVKRQSLRFYYPTAVLRRQNSAIAGGCIP